MKDTQIARLPSKNVFLRVKIKDLAYEAKLIRIEEERANKAHNFTLQNQLHEHRIGRVRTAARETILAYMYLRNFPYEAIEHKDSKSLSTDSIKAIERMCRKYGSVTMSVIDWQKGKRMVERKAAQI